MQSVLVYGRLLTRALVNGVYNVSNTSSETQEITTTSIGGGHKIRAGFHRGTTATEEPPPLVSAWSGFSKELTNSVKKGQFGDDAFFIRKHKSIDVFGVADGVGGWRTYGIDPSHFSGTLMRTCERLVSLGRFNPQTPASIIANGYNELLENKEQIIGSSTACVVALNRSEGKVYTANIGDSGFLVVRSGKVVHRSEEQQHYFNTPYQLSLVPPAQSGRVLSDSPESADTSQFTVRDGDLILVATDGLFDNMPDSLIVAELAKLKDINTESIQRTANSIASQARKLAFDANYMSPFSIRARENGIDTIGGKPDDITVLLASVTL